MTGSGNDDPTLVLPPWATNPPVDLGIPGINAAIVVGAGGSGVVYRAHQREFNRAVAVKLLPPSALAGEAFDRFQRELRAMGPLSAHPNIVSVYSAGVSTEGRPYIVMEFVAGGSLQDRLAAGVAFSLDEALRAGSAAAEGLAAAHDIGILHRDVKPANILVSSFGVHKLADFGIARIPGGHETGAGQLTGTVSHLAPELLLGAAPSVASDVYSLASTVFTLLAGHAPFQLPGVDLSIAQQLHRISAAPIPDLRARGIPPPVAAAVEAGLARDPARRPQSARHFGAMLQSALGGDTVPGTVRRRLPGWSPQRRALGAIGAAAAVSAGAVGLALWKPWGPAPTPIAVTTTTTAPTVAPRTSTPGPSATPSPTPTTSQVITFEPLGFSGSTNSGISATSTASGSCFGSIASIRPDAYRCSAGNEIFDPCFSPPQGSPQTAVVACPVDPRSGQVVVINLGSALTEPASTIAGAPVAWAVELSDGELCRILTGASVSIAGQNVSYTCSAGGVIVGSVDTGRSSITVTFGASSTAGTLQSMGVTRAWV